ncbi:3-deoxy-D-arabino-heptulosonate 7-phosphate (DAHP) synthase class II [Rhizobium alvei]
MRENDTPSIWNYRIKKTLRLLLIVNNKQRNLRLYRERFATNNPSLRETDFFSRQDARLLGYEDALTRADFTLGDWYGMLGHVIWIDDRTRKPDHAHTGNCYCRLFLSARRERADYHDVNFA